MQLNLHNFFFLPLFLKHPILPCFPAIFFFHVPESGKKNWMNKFSASWLLHSVERKSLYCSPFFALFLLFHFSLKLFVFEVAKISRQLHSEETFSSSSKLLDFLSTPPHFLKIIRRKFLLWKLILRLILIFLFFLFVSSFLISIQILLEPQYGAGEAAEETRLTTHSTLAQKRAFDVNVIKGWGSSGNRRVEMWKWMECR